MTDYYADLGLDPAAPSPALAARLTAEIDAMPPGPDRVYREQARAILSDEDRRRFYDTRLRDPRAQPWTPQELHELALAAPAPGSRVAAVVGTGARRVMVMVAAGLAALLVLLIALTACGGDSDGDGAAAGLPAGLEVGSSERQNTDSEPPTAESECKISEPGRFRALGNKPESDGTRTFLRITDAYPLPAEPGAALSRFTQSSGPYDAIQVYPNGEFNISFRETSDGYLGGFTGSRRGGYSQYLLHHAADGTLLGQQTTRGVESTSRDDRAVETQGTISPVDPPTTDYVEYGDLRVAAVEGITLPPSTNATVDEPELSYALNINNSEDHVWVLLRGGTDLYRGEVVTTSGPIADCLG